MSKRLFSQLSDIYEPPELAVPGELLSAAEIDQFKTFGFLFKRGLIDATDLTQAMNRIWEVLLATVPPAEESNWQLRPDQPETWQSPQWAPMPPADKSGFFEGRQRTFASGRAIKMHEIGNQEFLLELVPNNPKIKAVAQQLLSDRLKPIERTRGVYALFPARQKTDNNGSWITGRALGPHTDRVCQQLNVCAYLEDVPPRSGGFTVYPGSHRLMFKAHTYEANWSPNEQFPSAMQQVVASIKPVEFSGKRGDVVFWHGRTVHTAGIHTGDAIRWAVFADYTEDRPLVDADGHRAVGQYEWFKDAKLFQHDEQASEDLWRSWRISSNP